MQFAQLFVSASVDPKVTQFNCWLLVIYPILSRKDWLKGQATFAAGDTLSMCVPMVAGPSPKQNHCWNIA